eukprot:5180779-Prymnesium_polylepis.1
MIPCLRRGDTDGMQLTDLPPDVMLRCIGSLTEPADVVASAAPVCHAFHTAATADCVWKELLESRYSALLSKVFGGHTPGPTPMQSWRNHYFTFASSWREHAAA